MLRITNQNRRLTENRLHFFDNSLKKKKFNYFLSKLMHNSMGIVVIVLI